MSSNPLTSEDLLRCRRVLDEALAADKLNSEQYRTRIRALVVAVNKGDLCVLIRDLIPGVGEPGFTDEGHELPVVFSSVPEGPPPRPEDETTRAVRIARADVSVDPAPVDSFPSFPSEDDLYPDGEDSYPGDDGLYPDEDVPEPVTESSPEPLGVDDPVTSVVPVMPPEIPADPIPGELVPIRQWSAEVSPRERASTSAELSPLERRSAEVSPLESLPGRELSPRERRSAEVSPLESLPGRELSPRERRSAEVSPLEPLPGRESSPVEQGDDDPVNRVAVVPSAPSPNEPGVIRSSWDDLPSPEPSPAEPEPMEPGAEQEPEEDEPVTRISAPMGFDDFEAPTQVLNAVKDLPIFREETSGENAEPPQPVLPYSINQDFSGTPTDPMARATTVPSTGNAAPQMPPPIPEPSDAVLASMPPPTPPSTTPPSDPWASYGQDPLAAMPPPPDPAVMAPPPMSDYGYGPAPAAPYYGSQYMAGPMPPPGVSYQPPVPAYGSEPAQQQAPRGRNTWAWVAVTMMVLALLVWVAYLVLFR